MNNYKTITISDEMAERLLQILKKWLLECEDLIRNIEEQVYPEKFKKTT